MGHACEDLIWPLEVALTRMLVRRVYVDSTGKECSSGSTPSTRAIRRRCLRTRSPIRPASPPLLSGMCTVPPVKMVRSVLVCHSGRAVVRTWHECVVQLRHPRIVSELHTDGALTTLQILLSYRASTSCCTARLRCLVVGSICMLPTPPGRL